VLPIGGFAAGPDITGLTGLVAVAAGDFTGTGVVDFAVVNALENTVTIVANGKPVAAYNVGVNPCAIVIADFNGDGHMDLAGSQRRRQFGEYSAWKRRPYLRAGQ